MRAGRSPYDPKGLIYEAFRIEGITDAECRSIFLDWALSLPEGTSQRSALIALCKDTPQDHPMTTLLTQARDQQPVTSRGRRGGRSSRIKDD